MTDDFTPLGEEYTLVIDTDSFMDDGLNDMLCAYCTGYPRSDGAQREYSELYFMEMGLEDDHEGTADEKNPFSDSIVYRFSGEEMDPSSVWINKKYGYRFEDSKCDGEESTIKTVVISPNDFEDCEPAPFSVGIHFGDRPTAEQIQIIKDRANRFFEKVWPKNASDYEPKLIKVEGLRLITHRKYAKEEAL